MCIITGPVDSVSATRIFLAPTVATDGKDHRQLIVYSNSVASPRQNMMILPVPNPETIKFETGVMEYRGLFTDLSDSLSLLSSSQALLWGTRSAPHEAAAKPLPVFDVGSYQVSVALTLEDLYRLNTGIFQIDDNLFRILQESYPRRIGYICCKLKAGGNTYEPIAYSHKRDEEERLFVPTKHYHPSSQKYVSSTLEADWDHTIYSVGTHVSAHRNQRDMYIPKQRNSVDWARLPREFRWTPGHKIHRWACTGEYANIDVGLSVY